MFSVLVAADIFGTKLNYELQFAGPPSVIELQKRIEHVFGGESNARRPPQFPAGATQFTIQRLQVFDDRVELWVDLLSSSQLTPSCQVYAFQPETQFHKEVQSKLPPAERLPAAAAAPPLHHPFPPPYQPPLPTTPPSAQVARNQAVQDYRLAQAAEAMHAHQRERLHPQPPAPPVAAAQHAAAAASAAYAATAARALYDPPLQHLLPPGTPPPPPRLQAAAEVDPPAAEKVRAVFDEIDGRRAGAAHLADFATLLRTLQIELPGPLAVNDLFRKDPAHETLVTYPEFEAFGEKYPTLLDALFSRCREFWVGVRQKEGLEQAAAALEHLHALGSDAHAKAMHAAAAAQGQESKLQKAAAELQQQEAVEADAAARLQAARAEKDRLSAEVSSRAAEMTRAAENTRVVDADLMESVRHCEQVEAMLRSQEAETQRCEDKLAEIERALHAQQQELEAMRVSQAQRRAEVAAAQSHQTAVLQAKQECERVVLLMEEQLNATEVAMNIAHERERESEFAHQAAHDTCSRYRMMREADEHELHALRDQEAALKAHEAEAFGSVQSQQATMFALEQECKEHLLMISRVQQEEQPLIDQEVHLRAQRDALEAKEAQLRTQHTSFQIRNGARSLVASQAAAAANAAAFAYSAHAPAPPGAASEHQLVGSGLSGT
eukprot:gene5705-8708_t